MWQRFLCWPGRNGYYSYVKKASITDAKNNLSALIDSVRGGSSVLIVDRGRPVARLEPLRGVAGSDDLLGRLIREGSVRPARSAAARSVFSTTPPRLKKPVSAVRALLDERREGR
jgi:prevent-host-death family protein